MMARKAEINAPQAGNLTVDQWTERRTFCAWYLLPAALTFAAVPQAIPEAHTAWRTLRGT